MSTLLRVRHPKVIGEPPPGACPGGSFPLLFHLSQREAGSNSFGKIIPIRLIRNGLIIYGVVRTIYRIARGSRSTPYSVWSTIGTYGVLGLRNLTSDLICIFIVIGGRGGSSSQSVPLMLKQ